MREGMTIYDIAKIAGVSASTVSRVINGQPNVKKETKARVMSVLKEHNYVPNEAARELVMQSSRMVGIFISDIRTTHHTDGIFYIQRELSKRGYTCLIYNTGTDEENQEHYIQLLSQRKVEAAILMGSVYQTETIRKAIQKYQNTTPVFICNGYLDEPNVYGLIADEEVGVCQCVKLLAGKGRKNLAFVVDYYTPSNRLKLRGFENGVLQYCDGNESQVVVTGDSTQNIIDATCKLLREHPETNGIIFSEDMLAAFGLRALHSMSLSVPERVAVVGINNSSYAEICIPALTSLNNMQHDLCLMTVRNLIAVLDGEQVSKKMIICSSIVERQST